MDALSKYVPIKDIGADAENPRGIDELPQATAASPDFDTIESSESPAYMVPAAKTSDLLHIELPMSSGYRQSHIPICVCFRRVGYISCADDAYTQYVFAPARL